jgi:DNA polymerase-3 subunit gamma/tau
VSYEPLHHKYRPQTFANLVGQEAIATTLTNAIRTERIAPAYLFTGPRGTGKTSSARILAKSLNCKKQDKPTEQPCGVCEVCKSIASGNALDVIEIDAASNTGVDNIREIIERAQFAPVQCRYKVYVIDECHMLSGAAFNSLLKTLEEPPNRVVFVLATTDPQRVLPTIISRCQRFDFRRIPLEAMVSHLQYIAAQENISITTDAITLVAQVAQGGLRDAESLLDQLSLLVGEVTVERVWDLVGAVPERDLMALTDAIASNNPETVLETARHLMDRGREPLIVLQNLAGFYRDLLIAKTAPTRNDLVAITTPTWITMCDFAKSLDTNTILAGQKHLKDSEVQIKNTTQPRLWLEVTLLGLLHSANSHPSSESPSTQSLQRSTSPTTQNTVSQPSPRSTVPASNASTASVSLPTPSTEVTRASQISAPREQLASNTPISQPTVSDRTAPPESQTVASSDNSSAHPPEASLAAPSTVTDHSDLDQIWQQVLAQLKPISTRELLRQLGRLIDLDNQYARVSIPQAWREKIQERLPNIEAAFQEAINRKVKVSLQARATDAFDSALVNRPTSQGSRVAPSQQPAPNHSPPSTTRQVMSDHVQPSVQKNGEEALLAQRGVSSFNVDSNNVLLRDSASSATQRQNLAVATPSASEQAGAGTPVMEQPQAQVETHPSWTGTTDNHSPLTLPAQNKDTEYDSDVVEKALVNLQQFFEGEIVDLADDFIPSEPLVTHQQQDNPFVASTALSEEVVIIPEIELEPEAEEELDLIEPTVTRQLPYSDTTSSNPLQRSSNLEDSQDDDDIPFVRSLSFGIREANLQDPWELEANRPGIWLYGNRGLSRFHRD